jgi:LmbE family N-acetylglucosaminyl deacetylase
MAKAAADGHRVVLVCATRGEEGEPKPGVLSEGELLQDRRVSELALSCEILGADAPRFLDYEDSGMMGEPSNDSPTCFWQADVDKAATRLAAILREVDANVLTIYDDHGLYGHPDHIQVHRVGLAAAKQFGNELKVYESTVNRDVALASFDRMSEETGDQGPSLEEMQEFGVAQKDLAYSMDITEFIDVKRKSMRAHESQISEDDFFLTIPNEAFGHMFGTEWFAEPGRSDTGGPVPVDLLPGL